MVTSEESQPLPADIRGLPCISGRVRRAELLDAAEASEAARNLRELARINRWFGGHRTLLKLFSDLVRPHEAFSLLDVGAASGDMGLALRKRFSQASIVSLDRQPSHMQSAVSPQVAADALALPFASASFDFVLCSSLLHHFSEDQAITLLREMHRLARRAVVVLDLERNPLAYFFLPLTRALFGWSELTVHDGCASVEAAFRLPELNCLAQSLAPARIILRRHYPWFRISLVALAD